MAEELVVQTPIGEIVAKKSTDKEHPGIYLTIYDKNKGEQACMLAEYCDKDYNSSCRSTENDSIVLRMDLDPVGDMEILQEITEESIKNNTPMYNNEVLKGV